MKKTQPGALPERMAETLRKYHMLTKGSRVLVAFSGGADSLALLCALSAVREEWDLRLAAAHLDHGLRGEASRADADWAEAFCRARGIPFFRGCWPGGRLTKAGQSPEAAARKARRSFLESALAQWPGDLIALGHHLDDQAETVLLHLLHGAGLRGIGGMYPVRGLYIRPLLELRKTEIRAYVGALGLVPREDASNANPAYLRNRLRMQVIPLLEDCNPGFSAAAGRLAELARREDAFLDGAAAAALAGMIPPDDGWLDTGPDVGLDGSRLCAWRKLAGGKGQSAGGSRARIGLRGLLALDPVLARRALRLWLAGRTDEEDETDGAGGAGRNGGRAVSDLAGIERIYALARGGQTGKTAEAAGGFRVEKEKDSLLLLRRPGEKEKAEAKRMRADAASLCFCLPLEAGEMRLPGRENLRLNVRFTEGSFREAGPAVAKESAGETAPGEPRAMPAGAQPFDRWFCRWPAGEALPVLRVRRPGDWLLMPYGRKKLKDLLAEKGVPRALRDALPLLALEDRVLWVPGVVCAPGLHGGGFFPARGRLPAENSAQPAERPVLSAETSVLPAEVPPSRECAAENPSAEKKQQAEKQIEITCFLS